MDKIIYIPDNVIECYEKKLEERKAQVPWITGYKHQPWLTAAEQGKFSVDDLHYFGSMNPQRHSNYRLLTSSFYVVSGTIIACQGRFANFSFQGVICGLALLFTTLIIQRCFTPKTVLLMTLVGSGVSIYLLVCAIRVLVLEKSIVTELWSDGHRQSASMICLFIVCICAVTEVLVFMSVLVTCLTYADVVERLDVYKTVLDLNARDPEQYNHVLQSWESSDEGESDDDDQLKANATDRQKEEEIAAQEAMEEVAAQEAMENDLMMQNEMEAEIDMAMNDLGDQPD